MNELVGTKTHTVTKRQVTEAILELLSGTTKLFPYTFENPAEVNKGHCEEFACAVLSRLDYPDNLSVGLPTFDIPDLWGHVWLELRSNETVTYFDAEVEYGVESHTELPHYMRN